SARNLAGVPGGRAPRPGTTPRRPMRRPTPGAAHVQGQPQSSYLLGCFLPWLSIGILTHGDVTSLRIIPPRRCLRHATPRPCLLFVGDGEQTCQQLPAAADAAHDRADRYRGDLRDFPVLQTVHVVKRSEEHTSELQSRENLVCR